MFRGANKLTLDAKGRIVMPTRYRERLQEICGGRLVVTVDKDRCLLIYPLPDWETIERFSDIVFNAGYASPVRTPRGRDILAACGQLKSETEKLRARARRMGTGAHEYKHHCSGMGRYVSRGGGAYQSVRERWYDCAEGTGHW